MQDTSYIPDGNPGRYGGGTYTNYPTEPTLRDYENIFGPSARDIKDDLQKYKRHGRWHLPDVLQGPNPWMADRIDGLITDATNSAFTSYILPYKYFENVDGKIKWNVWSFDEGMASRVPYESAARTLTQSKRSFAGYAVRHGLAINLEHNFMMTPKGRENFQNQLNQLVGSIQYTNDLDVHVALILAPSYEKEMRSRFIPANEPPGQVCRQFIDLFGFMQKNQNALDIMIEEAKYRMKAWGGPTPNFMLTNSKLTFQMTMTPDKTNYVTQGPDGVKRLQAGPELNSYRGLKIIESRMFSMENGQPPRDLLRRRVRVAEYYRVPVHHDNWQREFEFFNEARDTWFSLSFWDLLAMAHYQRDNTAEDARPEYQPANDNIIRDLVNHKSQIINALRGMPGVAGAPAPFAGAGGRGAQLPARRPQEGQPGQDNGQQEGGQQEDQAFQRAAAARAADGRQAALDRRGAPNRQPPVPHQATNVAGHHEYDVAEFKDIARKKNQELPRDGNGIVTVSIATLLAMYLSDAAGTRSCIWAPAQPASVITTENVAREFGFVMEAHPKPTEVTMVNAATGTDEAMAKKCLRMIRNARRCAMPAQAIRGAHGDQVTVDLEALREMPARPFETVLQPVGAVFEPNNPAWDRVFSDNTLDHEMVQRSLMVPLELANWVMETTPTPEVYTAFGGILTEAAKAHHGSRAAFSCDVLERIQHTGLGQGSKGKGTALKSFAWTWPYAANTYVEDPTLAGAVLPRYQPAQDFIQAQNKASLDLEVLRAARDHAAFRDWSAATQINVANLPSAAEDTARFGREVFEGLKRRVCGDPYMSTQVKPSRAEYLASAIRNTPKQSTAPEYGGRGERVYTVPSEMSVDYWTNQLRAHRAATSSKLGVKLPANAFRAPADADGPGMYNPEVVDVDDGGDLNADWLAAAIEHMRRTEIVVLRPNIEHNMMGIIIGLAGDTLGNTLWGQTELSVYDDSMHGIWGMSYKYHERAIVFNEKCLVRLWDIAYDGYNGGKDDTYVRWTDGESVRKFNEATVDMTKSYTGSSMMVMAFVHEDELPGYKRNWPSPIVFDDHFNYVDGRDEPADQMSVPVGFDNLHVVDTSSFKVFNHPAYGAYHHYHKKMPSFKELHRLRKDAGMCTQENDTPSDSLAFQGSMRTRQNGILIEEIQGSGHHGPDFAGAASVRAGKGYKIISQPTQQRLV